MDPEKEELKTQLQTLLLAVGKGVIEEVEAVINWFDQDLARNKQVLAELYALGTRCPTQNDVIISACFNKQPDILYYLLKKTNILDYLINPANDETVVHNQRKKAIQHALHCDAFCMVEMLYDYWCGDLYWIGHDVRKFEALGRLLEDARIVNIRRRQQLLINYHSLIMFNNFQQTIYKSLPTKTPSEITRKELVTALVRVLGIYDKFSELDMVRIRHDSDVEERQLRKHFADRSSMYYKGLANVMYEVYYRKMDFNVSLLILENLYLLRGCLIKRFNKTEKYFKDHTEIKIRYENAAELYKQTESAIYHFVYRTYEDWRLYLPKERLITVEKHHTGRHEGHLIRNLTLTYDSRKLFNGSVIYFERKRFKYLLKKFKRILKKHILGRDPSSSWIQQGSSETITILDNNYLKPIMYMKNHYALRKIIDYIQAIESTNGLNLLMIERVLQVIGEMTKTSKDSCHISKSTKAFLQVALSVETIKLIHDIREFVSHAYKGQLSTRIHSENQHKQTFHQILKDLKEIKEVFIAILKIYKYKLDKSLLDKGLSLLTKRLEQLPDAASQNLQIILTQYETLREDLFLETSDFVQQVWNPTGFTIQLLKEIVWIGNNRNEISLKIQKTKTSMDDSVIDILPNCIQSIRRWLELIAENNNYVSMANTELSKYRIMILPVCPNMKEINECQKERKRIQKKRGKQVNDDLKALDDVKDYSIHWKSIKNLLRFCLDECELFASIRQRLSFGSLDETSEPDNVNLTEVRHIIEEMEAVCLMHTSTLAWLTGRRLSLWGLQIYRSYKSDFAFKSKHPSFTGIETMYDINVHNNKAVQANLPNVKNYQFWRIVQKELILCLINRVTLLQGVLGYPQVASDAQLIRRYKQDKKFRIELEMLLADIGNVLGQCNKTIKIMKKPTQLLSGIDLGNVLDHGDPFLEVLAGVFDTYELPKAYVCKAKELAGDKQAIEALYELFQSDVDHSTIKGSDLSKMNDAQKIHYAEFQKSQNWKSYAHIFFVPMKCRPKPPANLPTNPPTNLLIN
ncbi:hypothetical protein B5X24_HaOG217197 [Helicoverpa armigera]|uniref:Uncharacterized protein n=1 Tax=Helicoverpa armigera TaxID=29058 RepID=A0A2W1BUU0_HELAM|nr:hypothetical protein B5X24_HaOG217197 [Helicoverpa armigera]